MYINYSAWGVGVARFKLPGNAKAFTSWSERQASAPRLFCACPKQLNLLMTAEGAREKNVLLL